MTGLVEARRLSVHYPLAQPFWRRGRGRVVQAVNLVDLVVGAGRDARARG